jgi:hypothetical protein
MIESNRRKMLMVPPARRWFKSLFTTRSAVALVTLLLVDVVFIQLDRMYLQGRLPEMFSFDSESGYAELYQNGKEFAVTLLTLACLVTTREPLYGCWLGIFSYVFLDDTFQIHERLGAWVSQRFALAGPFGLRGDDIGELMVSAAAGAIVCVALIGAWRRSTQDARRVSLVLIALLFALGFFGIVMDMLHVVMTGTWEYRLGIVEDGGEMLVVTTVLWFLYMTCRAPSSIISESA